MSDPQLVPLGTDLPATTRDAERSTSGSSLLLYQTDAGAIHASLRFARIRRLRIVFAFDVVNATDEPLLATFYALSKASDEVPVPPHALWIDKRTEAYLELPLSWLAATTCRALSVRLQGRNVHQRLEASMPRPTSAGWFAAGVLLAALVILLHMVLQPRVASMSVASPAIAGSTMNMHYRFRGVGSREWEVDDINGGRIDGGSLSSNEGTAPIPVPRAPAQTTYVMRVMSHGAFGSAVAERPFVAQTPLPAAGPPRISTLTLDQAEVLDGSPVVVRYRVSAQYGDVVASDAQGTVWAQQPLNAQGVTTLSLPRFGRDKELQIRLVARRGDAEVSSGIGLSVRAAATPGPSGSPPADVSAVRVLDAEVHAGGVLRLQIDPSVRDVVVSFTKEDGSAVAPATRVQTAGTVLLRVPRMSPGTIVVVATYVLGSEQQTIVRPLRVV